MFLLRLAAVLTMLLAIGCLPKPPANVPEGAVWVGSGKEGCFLKIGERVPSGWHMEGWDKSGAQILDGIWELEGIARAQINTKKITKFDGNTFYLEDGAKITRQ